MDSVPSEPPSRPSPRLLLTRRLVYSPLLRILLRQYHVQEVVAVRNKIENLLYYVTTLDERFMMTQPDGVEDQRKRQELIEYAITFPRGPVLSSSQKAQWH